MTYVTDTFLTTLAEFSRESMKWCSEESEKATTKVSDILNLIMTNANRVSALTEETKEAIQSMKQMIVALGKSDRSAANKLASALHDTAKQDEEIEAFIAPVIETLQFQDRISQNMNNLSKMLHAWLEFRPTLAQETTLSQEKKVEFGQILLKLTAMEEERNLIHSRIEGIPQEEREQQNVFFF